MNDRYKAILTMGAGLAVLSAFMIVLGGHWFWEDLTPYSIRFTTVKDLTTGRPVKYGGLDIGRIEEIDLDPEDPRYIRVVIGVDSKFPLYQGTMARIAQKGLVGDFYVFLELKGKPGPRIEPEGVIPAMKTADFQEIANNFGELLQDIKPKIDEIATNFNRLFSKENVEAMRLILKKGPGFIESTQKAVTEAQQDWRKLVEGGLQVTGSMDDTLGGVNQSVRSVEKELQATLAEFRKQALKAGELAESIQDGFEYDQEQIEEILGNVNRSSREMKELIGRLRERPWEAIRPPREAKQ